MRILAFPKAGIAYNDSFYRAVEALGVQVIEAEFGGRWLLSNARRGDWLHFHWPSFSYSIDGSVPVKAAWFARFVLLLALARLRGARIAWTAHNLWPHDRDRCAIIDSLGRRAMIGVSALIFAHGPEALRVLGDGFPSARRKASAIPLGNWIDYYPKGVTRRLARERLGLADSSFVYLFFGLCKRYKNLDGLIRTFRDLGGDLVLAVAGRFPDPAYLAEIERLAGDDARVRLYPRFIPDEEVQCFMKACDVVVVPYREVLTSGTAMLAASFGRPVISVDLGNLRDVVKAESGILFAPDDATGLATAMRACTTRSFDEAAILARAREHTFEGAARAVVDAMTQVARKSGRPRAPQTPKTD